MILTQLLQHRGIKFYNGRSGEIRLCCPFCHLRGESVDTRFRLGVNTITGNGHCFNCGYASRRIISKLVRALKLPATEVQHGSEEHGIEIPEPVVLPEGYHPLSDPLDGLDRNALQYLLRRGVTEAQIKRNRIGVSFLGRYAYRIIFPVYEGNTLRGIVARALNENMNPRYLNNAGDKYLYNFRPAPEFVLLEGIFKALRVERILQLEGVNVRACALLGHDITEQQMQQLSRAGAERITLWPDPDKVGKRGMLKVAEKLHSPSRKIEIVFADQAADEAIWPLLRTQWRERLPYSWSIGNRILAGI